MDSTPKSWNQRRPDVGPSCPSHCDDITSRPRCASAGRRPVLILTRTDAIPHLSNVTIATLTRTRRGIPSEVLLTPADGLPDPCVISLDNIATIRKVILERRITTLTEARMEQVFAAIRHVFAMPAGARETPMPVRGQWQ